VENTKYIFDKEGLGVKIQSMRKEQKVSQETLAVDCNVDVRTIQRIEKGEQNITMELLFSIANSLKISPEELISFAVQLK
jgi:transcriptional regulator with XRE-family HTH domain